MPVDISADHLYESASLIRSEFPHIQVLPVVADFTKPFDLPVPDVMPLRNIVYFPGSTIGNFEEAAALDLLKVMYHEAKEDGALLIGVDLQKDPGIIEAAYNDSAGVTAQFNLNMLRHLNNEYGANFNLDAFKHEATYVEDEGRVAIRLISERDQAVRIDGERIAIDRGESILTEYSHKYTLAAFREMAAKAGFAVEKVWTDEDRLFSVQYCTHD